MKLNVDGAVANSQNKAVGVRKAILTCTGRPMRACVVGSTGDPSACKLALVHVCAVGSAGDTSACKLAFLVYTCYLPFTLT